MAEHTTGRKRLTVLGSARTSFKNQTNQAGGIQIEITDKDKRSQNATVCVIQNTVGGKENIPPNTPRPHTTEWRRQYQTQYRANKKSVLGASGKQSQSSPCSEILDLTIDEATPEEAKKAQRREYQKEWRKPRNALSTSSDILDLTIESSTPKSTPSDILELTIQSETPGSVKRAKRNEYQREYRKQKKRSC